jgi:membrane fusion protein (multidrug efflux system)
MTSTTPDQVRERPRSSRPLRQRLLRARWLRLVLMFALPLAIVIGGGWWYLTSGRYVSTDDAYVEADTVTISSDVSGRVVAVDVHNNAYVRQGQVLIRLDDRPYRAAVEQARAQLANARLQVEALRATYRQRLADLAAAQSNLTYAQREYDRQKELLAAHVTSQAGFDQTQTRLNTAQQQVAGVQQQIANVLASLGGNPDLPTEQHPLVQQAQAQLDQAELNLGYTVIRAPANGIVTNVDKLPVGNYLAASAPAFSLVETDHPWVEANFKETELAHMKPGDAATFTVDAYPGVTFQAHVASLSPGTGAQFSVLPPQNATGNWVKVVQRLPVRIALNEPDPDHPLRAGMSVYVDVDTRYEPPLARKLAAIF